MTENIITPTTYFAEPGPKNTAQLLDLAAGRFNELGLKKVVIASRTGRTAQEALARFDPQKCDFICVTYVTGFSEPNVQRLPEDARNRLQGRGVKMITAAHAFGGVGRGIRNKLGAHQVDEIMAYTLRIFGQGVKVGVEIALMAADAGLVRTDEDIMTIAGSGGGADTAMVLRPSNSHTCLDLKVREIVAKPWRP